MIRTTPILLTLILLGFCSFSNAQTLKITSENFFDLPKDVNTMMALTKNAETIQIGKDFESVWGASLSESQQKKIFSMSKTMAERRYKASPQFSFFYSAIYHAIHTQNISATELDKFLTAAEFVINKNEPKQIGRFFDVSKYFFEKRALYYSKYNRLYAEGGTFSFEIKDLNPVVVDKPILNKDDKKNDVKKEVKYDKNGWPIEDDKKDVKKEQKIVKYDKDGWPVYEDQQPDANVGIVDTSNTAPVAIYEKQIQPEISGVILVLKNVNLIFASKPDSVTLENTSGTLMFKDGIFVGNTGKFSWASVNLPNVFADFKEYNLDIRLPKLHAEEVSIHYDSVLSKPVAGIFDYEGRQHKNARDAAFPCFGSIHNDISIKNIGKNLIYKGGFSLAGNRILSTSYFNKPSTLSYVDGGTKFKLTSRQFIFGDSLITSPATSAVFYKDKDSIIYHPSVLLKFNKNSHMLQLNRQQQSYRNAPFSDTYHKVDVTVDAVKWYMDSTYIDFQMVRGRDSIPALFESHDFFNESRYLSLKGVYKFHPLQMLASYCKTKGLPLDKSPKISVEDLASTYKQDLNTIKKAMANLSEQGYVDFDAVSGLVTIYPKATHNVAVYQGQKDFDNFLIPSYTVIKPNATYDLSSNILTIRGIDGFNVRGKDESGRNKKGAVTIKPNKDAKSIEDKEIQLLQGRNFVLSTDHQSEVKIGGNRWVGKGFVFNYDEFNVDMTDIDSVIYSKLDTVVDKNGAKKVVRNEYGGEIKYKKGTVNIDDNQNKSGSKEGVGYPKFATESGGTIYFKDRMDGTYGDSVYFYIPKAGQDNLDKAEPVFIGTFKSGNLLPDITGINLVYKEGKPGFTHSPPPEGYSIQKDKYGNKAKIKFASTLIMDKQGLHTSGQIDYLTTTVKSNLFTFTPDSIYAEGNVADIREAVVGEGAFPKVGIKDFKMMWLVKKDSLNLLDTKDPFDLYKQTTKFSGTLIVNSKGLYGSGRLSRKDCEVLNSPGYKFEKDKFTAKDADFNIFSTIPSKPVLHANFVNLNFDLTRGLANIKTSSDPQYAGFASFEFPYARYKTSINQANWDINKKLIAMNGDVKTSTFSSLDETDQEDLQFNANIGLYIIDKLTLNIGGIPFIKSADAKIIPNRGTVTIEENAVMRELQKAQLEIDTLSGIHKFFDGVIRITSHTKFDGSATLKYSNPDGQTFNVKFGDFTTVEDNIPQEGSKKKTIKRTYTTATGVVNKEDNFRISSQLLFYGNITMKAPERNLSMDGYIKLDLKSQPELGRWIAYKGGDKDISIEVNEKLEGEGYPLTAGLFVDKTSYEIYSTFLSEKHNPEDEDILRGKGKLSYSPELNEFSISDVEKSAGVLYSGNRISLNDSTGIIKLDGKLNLTHSIPPDYLSISGIGEMNLKTKNFALNTFLLVNFPMNQNVVTGAGDKIMQSKANESTQKEANEDKEKLYIKLSEIIGEKATKDYKEKLDANYVPLYTSSKKLLAPIVLSNVDLKWSENNNAFYSTGKIGVSNMGNVDINSQFDGYVEIKKHPEGDEFALYLEISPDIWYFYNYKQGQLGAVSSDEDFNNSVAKGSGKVKAGQYAVIPVGADEKISFIDRFKTNYTNEVKKADNKKANQKKTDTKTDKKDGF